MAVAKASGTEQVVAFCARSTPYAELLPSDPLVTPRNRCDAHAAPDLSRGAAAPRCASPELVAKPSEHSWRESSRPIGEAVTASGSGRSNCVEPKRSGSDRCAHLADYTNTEPADGFPCNPSAVECAGLYSWWADEAGSVLIAETLGGPVPAAVIYAGQAAATTTKSHTERAATLRSRIGGNHLRGNISSSTFRKTLAAVISSPSDLN